MEVSQKTKNDLQTKKKDNYIIGYFEIKNDNSNERIINDYENVINEYFLNINESKEMVKKIKDCEIFIDEKRINFNYNYNFEKKGKYIIKYIFKKQLISTSLMFFGCKSLTSLDLSNFNAQKVTNMEYMFYGCNSLISLDLSKMNLQKVTNMEYMFYDCKSLESIDLSNVKTNNATNMEYMFFSCYSLKSLNFQILILKM